MKCGVTFMLHKLSGSHGTESARLHQRNRLSVLTDQRARWCWKCTSNSTFHWKHLSCGKQEVGSAPQQFGHILIWSDLIYGYLSKHDVTIFSQPPYSAHLAHTDYCLYLWLKEILNGHQFARSHDKVATAAAPNEVTKNDLQGCFWQCYYCWKRFIMAEGRYFKGGV